jgi:hypothetical protein
MLHLESLQLTRLSEANSIRCHHPFELVYTPGNIMPLISWNNGLSLMIG